MLKVFLKSLPLYAGLSLFATHLMAADITGSDLILSGEITQNGVGSNYFKAVNNTFDGRACIGPACDGTEPFEQGPLRLKWSEPDILFHDSSTAAGISSNDWRLVVNSSTITHFSIQDVDGGTTPFTVEGGVPDSTLRLATGGYVGIGTDDPLAQLHVVGNVFAEGTFTASSDRNKKTNIRSLDAQDILDKIVAMPVSKWSYKSEQDVHHIGPMAQDFYAAFGLGATDTGITSIDTAGVAFAAIQALNQKLVEQNLSLELRVAEAEQRAKSMAQRVAELEQQNHRIEELVMRMVTGQAEPVAMK